VVPMHTVVSAELLAAAALVPNPYLDAYVEICGADSFTGTGHQALSDGVAALIAREHLVTRFAWAIPTASAIAEIVAHGQVAEIGAGAGYWASLIAAAGGDVVAFDEAPVGAGDNVFVADTAWFDVAVGGPEQASRFPDRSLLLCWPSYDTCFAADTLAAYTGDVVIYVGERMGGCTADDTFHSALEHTFTLTSTVKIPCWYGINDNLTVWRRH